MKRKKQTPPRIEICDNKENAAHLRRVAERDRTILGLVAQVAALGQHVDLIGKRPRHDKKLIVGIRAAAGETRTLAMAIPATNENKLQAKITAASEAALLATFGNFEQIAAASMFAEIKQLKPRPQPWLRAWTRH